MGEHVYCEWEDVILPHSLGYVIWTFIKVRECSVMSSGPKVNPFLASIPAVFNESIWFPNMQFVKSSSCVLSVKHIITNNA